MVSWVAIILCPCINEAVLLNLDLTSCKYCSYMAVGTQFVRLFRSYIANVSTMQCNLVDK